MRGAVIWFLALLALCSRVHSRPLPLPGSRMVVMPWPIQSLKTYSAGVPCATPPMCACMSTKPGSTYIPSRLSSLSPRFAFGRFFSSIGTPGWPTLLISTMRFRSTTMSTGPMAGAPVPSIRVAPRRMSRSKGPSPSARGGALGTDFFSLSCAWPGTASHKHTSATKLSTTLPDFCMVPPAHQLLIADPAALRRGRPTKL